MSNRPDEPDPPRRGPVLIDLEPRAEARPDAGPDVGATPGADAEARTGAGPGARHGAGPATAARPGPVTIEDLPPAPSPADAPPVDAEEAPSGQAMRTLAVLSARRSSPLGAWALRLAGALVTLAASVALWAFVEDLMARSAVLGWVALALTVALAVVLLAIALREWAAFARLERLDHVHRAAEAAHTGGDLTGARDVVRQLVRLYADRPALEAPRREVEARLADVMDAPDLLALAETRLMTPLDEAASREVEAAARQVAAVTAVVPLALADLAAALGSNLRMIRRIAEIYGGRSGTLGTSRLTRAVFAHLVATGAVAVGEDLVGAVAGGSLLTRVSRRFGEGVVNGALTARVGVAAMEVCRPMPFRAARRPSVAAMVQRALTGLLARV